MIPDTKFRRLAVVEQFTDVCAAAELSQGTQRLVRIGSEQILLVRTSDEVYAVDWLCPHALQPLTGARIRNCTILCPRHGARFDLRTGAPLNAVTDRHLRVYRACIASEHIHVELRVTD